jgi:NAD(P)-dependent dehydrogenase (short-subunit alcohol dehydrogenase family)
MVTGGSRGLGRGLVEAFLARGANVAFCSRAEASVTATLQELSRFESRLLGVVADVAVYEDLAKAWAHAKARFGNVDVWINNAGTSNAQRPFVELDPADIAGVVATNLIGSMHGARVALAGMQAQGHGHIYNMEGFGSDGATQVGMAIYGSSKRAIRYFTRSLAKETRGGPVKIGSLSPGIVVTELLLDVYERGDPALFRRKRWLFNLIGDPVAVVAPWLADQVLAGPRHGAHVAWMTIPKAVLRAFNPAYHRRNLFGAQAL